jgi:hypothetical protein
MTRTRLRRARAFVGGGGGWTSLPGDIIFRSDWATALAQGAANSDAALFDNGKVAANRWTGKIGGGTWAADGAIIVANPGGFPAAMTNVFAVRIPQNPGLSAGGVAGDAGYARILRKTGMPVPAVGSSLYYRWYASVTIPFDEFPAGFDNAWHPVQDGQATGNANWEWEVVARRAGDLASAQPAIGKWRCRWYYKAKASGDTRFFKDLDYDTVYRFETRIHRTGENEFTPYVRVYGPDDLTLLYTNADFMGISGAQNVPMTGIVSPFVLAANLDGLNCGQNDVTIGMLGVVPPTTMDFGYQGGFMVRSSDWCGPYSALEAVA